MWCCIDDGNVLTALVGCSLRFFFCVLDSGLSLSCVERGLCVVQNVLQKTDDPHDYIVQDHRHIRLISVSNDLVCESVINVVVVVAAELLKYRIFTGIVAIPESRNSTRR